MAVSRLAHGWRWATHAVIFFFSPRLRTDTKQSQLEYSTIC